MASLPSAGNFADTADSARDASSSSPSTRAPRARAISRKAWRSLRLRPAGLTRGGWPLRRGTTFLSSGASRDALRAASNDTTVEANCGAGEAGACGSISAGSADREPDPAPLAASSPGTIAASEAGAATGTNVSSLQRPNPRKPFTLLSRSTIGTPDIDTMRPCPLPPTGQTRSTPVNVEPAASASEKRSSVSSTPRASSAGRSSPGTMVRSSPTKTASSAVGAANLPCSSTCHTKRTIWRPPTRVRRLSMVSSLSCAGVGAA